MSNAKIQGLSEAVAKFRKGLAEQGNVVLIAVAEHRSHASLKVTGGRFYAERHPCPFVQALFSGKREETSCAGDHIDLPEAAAHVQSAEVDRPAPLMDER